MLYETAGKNLDLHIAILVQEEKIAVKFKYPTLTLILKSYGSVRVTFFKEKFKNVSHFCEAANTPVWTSGDVFPGFQIQNGQPYLHLAEVLMMNVP